MKRDKPELDDRLIREKAHALWIERGCPSGTAHEDWRRAEQMLLGELASAAVPDGEAAPESRERETIPDASASAAPARRPKRARARKR